MFFTSTGRLIVDYFLLVDYFNNNNNNSHDNVYGAVIMTKVIARVHPFHLMTSRLLVDYRVDWSTAALITARVSNLACHSRVTVVAPLRLLGPRAPSTRPLLLPLTELHRTHTCIPIGQFTLNWTLRSGIFYARDFEQGTTLCRKL